MAIVALVLLVAAIGGPERLRAFAEGDGGCPAGDRIPTPAAVESARAATLCLLNRERAAQGLPALVVDARLTQAAQLHSDDMGKRDFYAHRDPDGVEPSARVYAQGLPPHGTTVAENIHWGTGLARGADGDRARLDEQPGTSPQHPQHRGLARRRGDRLRRAGARASGPGPGIHDELLRRAAIRREIDRRKLDASSKDG